jgi:iron complex outermembrane recepter protein
MKFYCFNHWLAVGLCGILFCITFQTFGQDYRQGKRSLRDAIFRRSTPSSPTQPNSSNTPANAPASVQQTIQSQVLEAGSKEPVSGAYIKVQGTLTGAVTDNEGRFSIKASLPATLEISSIGYSPATISILNLDVLNKMGQIELKSDEFMTDAVVVSASRVSERIMEAPAAIYKMDLAQIRSMPTINPVDAMAFTNQLEVTTSSFGVKNVNTRGFNLPNNVRFPHRIDGMEMLSPGFSFYMGAIDSWSSLDIDNIEVISGPASCLYGANAINGAMNFTTKNPFDYQGLSFNFRTGVFGLGNSNSDFNPASRYGPAYDLPASRSTVAPIAQGEIRYAKAFDAKWAFKLNISLLNTNDWLANDYTDRALFNNFTTVPDSRTIALGYDGFNTYGDEIATLIYGQTPIGFVPTGISVARTGFRERDLTDYNSRAINSSVAVHYRPNAKHELIFASRINRLNGIFQSLLDNRYRVDNAIFSQHKVEWRTSQAFLRFYMNKQWENAGRIYDMSLAGQEVNNTFKPHREWFGQFLGAYTGSINPVLTAIGRTPIPAGDANAARLFADSDNRDIGQFLRQIGASDSLVSVFAAGGARFNPGTPQFQSVFDRVRNTNISEGGARIHPASNLFNLEGQYDLSQWTDGFVDVLVGFNYRYCAAFTKNTAYQDDVEAVTTHELGMYVQLQRKWLNERLKTLASLRSDAHSEFKPQLSPRLAATYTLDSRGRHVLRAAYQTAFRFPTMTESFFSLSYGSLTRMVGGISRIMDRNGIRNNSLYLLGNALDFGALYRAADTAGALRALGQPQRPQSIESEKIQTYEVGYRGTFWNRFSVDMTAFYSVFQDFINFSLFVGPDRNRLLTSGEPLSTTELAASNFALYTIPTNLKEDIYFWGYNHSVTVSLHPQYKLFTTYSYLDVHSQSNLAINSFNVPKHRAALGLQGMNVWKHFGFTANYRWNDASIYNFYPIPAYNLVDLNVSYHYKPWKTIFSICGTNVLNHYHIEIAGGPNLGGTYYLQIYFDQLLN